MSANDREITPGTTETGEVGETVRAGESKEKPALRGVFTAKNVGLRFAKLTYESVIQLPNDPGMWRLAQAGQSHVLPRESPM